MKPDPVATEPGLPLRAPVFIQAWEPCVFVHWPVDVDAVTPLLPPGCTADTYDGRTYVGLIPLVIRRVQVFGGRPVRHVSTFTELNVRVYSVDAEGRRGIVFLSLDAERLVPVLAAQASYRLPYKCGPACRTRTPVTSTVGRRCGAGLGRSERGRKSP